MSAATVHQPSATLLSPALTTLSTPMPFAEKFYKLKSLKGTQRIPSRAGLGRHKSEKHAGGRANAATVRKAHDKPGHCERAT